MSTGLDQKTPVAWRGEDVSVGDVLNALNRIRRNFAQTEAGNSEHPHPRNCVMTLIAVASSDAEERRAERATTAIGKLHPSQVIVIRDDAELSGGRIDATIATDVHRPQTGCAAQCEVVTLRVRGASGDHLAPLVDPLLSSGVPVYLWWLGTPPFGKHEMDDVLKVCDSLVVDSARFEAPYHSFLRLTRIVTGAHHRLGVADLQWARLDPLREAIAGFFAPPERRPFLDGITELGLDYVGEGRGNRIGASLLTGWLSMALGWKLQSAAAGSGGVLSAHYSAAGWRPVEVAFRSVAKAGMAQGELSAVRIAGAAGGKTFHVTVMRDPERRRRQAPDLGAGAYQALHVAAGEDEAGLEIAQRKAVWHRDVLHENRDHLHHTATGAAPGESVPPGPNVFVTERRRENSSPLLLTLIDIGGAKTLRQVQTIEPENEATLLLQVLTQGARDRVFVRSLGGAAELMRSI